MKSGILLVDKPVGKTSAEVLNQIKKQHKVDKIGHGGTLDPFATGLLVILIGEATKIARFLLDGEKSYLATAKLGEETDTGDLTGTVLYTQAIPTLSQTEWQTYANEFLGHSQQHPPMYSAIKVQGKPLYEYARKGISIEVKARDIYLSAFKILPSDSEGLLAFSVTCSGGTYIRVLANDLAKKAGTYAHLLALRRTASSAFHIENAHPLEQLLSASELPLLPLTSALQHLPQITCTDMQVQKIRHGNLSVFQELKDQLIKPGYFLLVHKNHLTPIAIANHNPMLSPFCSIERVFDPSLAET